MDLRAIINNEAGDKSSSTQAAPVTPIQATPQQIFREYSHSSRASPGKQSSQDYGSQPGGPYASPNTYQANYSGRPPPPPPIQAPPQNDLQSPARSYSAQSPYQRTPSSTVSVAQYPFPQAHQTPQSPAQHHQYPPSFQQRESYPQTHTPNHLQHQSAHNQLSPAPQTPPIGVPGAPHPYLQHQRSHSSVSTSTPTSAHSQPPYFSQNPQDSPVSATQNPPSQIAQHVRQQSLQSQHSQPGTPLGPPLNQRQLSGSYTQPTSPYQQRQTSVGPFPHYQQTSPAPPAPASISRLPSTPNAYVPERPSLSEQHRRSQSERERSVSVSPKTRLPSQPRGEDIAASRPEVSYNSTKRKMEERESSVDQPRRIDQADVKSLVNGDHRIPLANVHSPNQPPKKRVRYTEPPIWARSIRDRNVVAASRGPVKVNGKQAVVTPTMKTTTNGNQHPPPTVARGPSSGDTPDTHPSMLLGPWEQSIAGIKPTEQLTKQIADFLFLHVVSRNDLGELASRGVEIEIEAKLGQLINIDNNERLSLPVTSECVISEGYRMVAFKSAMTENQHQVLNTFLNAKLAEAHPANPNRSKRRVEIVYVHRRETDKFYNLPPAMLGILPAAVRQHQNPRHAARIRVTHDQKTNQVLARIVKVRIADLNIFMPREPLDCRISVNLEMRYDGDMESIIAHSVPDRHADRNKDRLSYTQGHYQIDLTQVSKVKSHNGVDHVEKEHELEIEVATAAIRDQGGRAAAGEPNEYVALVEGLIDNIRVLSRAVPSH